MRGENAFIPVVVAISYDATSSAHGRRRRSCNFAKWEHEVSNTLSARAPQPVGPYPHAKRVGHLLFLSGLGPREPGTNRIPGVTLDADGEELSHDIVAQCRSVFDNIRVVLEDAGSSWDCIVDVTVFLTDLKNDFAAYNKVFAEYFAGPGKPNPTRTTVEVTRLPTAIAIEIKVIATMPSA